MDLTIPILASLALLGYNLNAGPKQARSGPERQTVSPNQVPNGDLPSVDANAKVQSLAVNAWNASLNPSGSGIIPAYFNSLSGTPAAGSLLGSASTLNFATNPSGFSPREERVYSSSLFQGGGAGIENFAPVNAPLPDMTNFTFNNAVPFFGGKMTQNTNFSMGSGTVPFKTKQEMANNTTPFRQNVFGAPSLTEEQIAAQQVASRIQNNVLPFQQLRPEPPIPAYIARPTYKTVDELRPANNPKISAPGRIAGPPKATGMPGLLGALRLKIGNVLHGPNRWFGAGGGIFHPTPPTENYTPSCTTRGEGATDQFGIATGNTRGPIPGVLMSGDNLNDFGSFVTRYSEPHKTTYKGDWMHNLGGPVPVMDLDTVQGSYCARTQQRESTSGMLLNPGGDANLGDYWAPTDPARPTLKECNLFGYTPNPESIVSAAPSRLMYDNMQIRTNKEELMDMNGYMYSGSATQIPTGANDLNVRTCADTQQLNRLDPNVLTNLNQNPYIIRLNPVPTNCP